MGKSLSHLSEEATQATNTTGVLSAILTAQPNDGVWWQFHNRVATGDAQGIPLIMDLRDSSNNQLPVDTEVILRVERAEDDEPNAVSVAEGNIAPWNDLTTAEQRDEDNIDAVKIELKDNNVNVRDSDTFSVDINSSTAIDWANSEAYFAREGIDEYPSE